MKVSGQADVRRIPRQDLEAAFGSIAPSLRRKGQQLLRRYNSTLYPVLAKRLAGHEYDSNHGTKVKIVEVLLGPSGRKFISSEKKRQKDQLVDFEMLQRAHFPLETAESVRQSLNSVFTKLRSKEKGEAKKVNETPS